MSIALISLVVIILDQISKYWVLQNLTGGKSISVMGSFMELTYLENRGIAFGLGQALAPFYPLIALGIVAGLLYFYQKEVGKKTLVSKLAVGFIVGGAIGNVIDRLLHAFVVDFISLHFGAYAFPVFNIADCFVTVGVFLLIIHLLFHEVDEERKEAQ